MNAIGKMMIGSNDRGRSEMSEACPHCGRELLSIHGAFSLMSMHPVRDAKLIEELDALPLACDCEGAVEARRADEVRRAEEERREVAAREQKRQLVCFAKSGMPAAWRDRGLRLWRRETQAQRVAWEAAVEFGEELCRKGGKPRSLFIAGDIGTGKTFLASCLARDLHRRGRRVRWARVGDILAEIKRGFHAPRRQQEEVLEVYKREAVLVLDDLGKERPTEWAVEQLFGLVNYRYEEALPLIVTTNYGAEGLVRRLTPSAAYGEQPDDTTARAIVDRLCEMSRGVQLTGKSWRQGDEGK